MTTITYKPRTGKDLIEYNQRLIIDSNLAVVWAMESFVMIGGEPISVEDIARLSDKSFLLISTKIFVSNNIGIEETDEYVIYQDYRIGIKPITKNIISNIQTTDKSDYTKLLINLMMKMYDVSRNDLDIMPYNLVNFLMEKIIFFLSELAKPSDSFDIEERDLFRAT